MLIQALGLQTSRLISLCGGGGKTSLMFALARELIASGEKILLTTTTKIAASEGKGVWPLMMAKDASGVIAAACQMNIAKGSAIIAVLKEKEDRKKLVGFAPEVIDELHETGFFDRILVEADGAKRRPLKAPSSNEPVIPSATDCLVMVVGLNGLGKPLNSDNVFRPHVWRELTGDLPEEPISPESLVKVVMHTRGLSKGTPLCACKVLYLNQVDTPERLEMARRVIEQIAEVGEGSIKKVVCGVLKPAPRIIAQDHLFPYSSI